MKRNEKQLLRTKGCCSYISLAAIRDLYQQFTMPLSSFLFSSCFNSEGLWNYFSSRKNLYVFVFPQVDCRQPCHLHLLVDLFGDSHTHKKGEDKQKPKESYSCILWTWGLTPGVGPPINNYVLSVYRRGLVRASLLNTSRRGVVNSAVPFHASPTSYTHLCCILFGWTFLIWFISPINLPSYIPSPFIWINKTYLFSAFCSVSMCRPMLLMLFQFSRQFSTWMNFDVILGIPPPPPPLSVSLSCCHPPPLLVCKSTQDSPALTVE